MNRVEGEREERGKKNGIEGIKVMKGTRIKGGGRKA